MLVPTHWVLKVQDTVTEKEEYYHEEMVMINKIQVEDRTTGQGHWMQTTN